MNNISDIRKATIRHLERHAIPNNMNLPVLEIAADEQWQNAKSIAKKLIVFYAMTGLAHDADPKKLINWLEANEVGASLSATERKYFECGKISPRDAINLSWRQEAMATLAWCLGIQNSLPFPNKEFDLALIFPKIPPEVEINNFLSKAERIAKVKIVQMVDFYFCYHWALRHPEIWKSPPSLNLDVVIERRRALSWIVGEAEDYDDISLDT